MASIISAESSCVRSVGCARNRKPESLVLVWCTESGWIGLTEALQQAAAEELIIEALVQPVDESIDVLCNRGLPV